MRCSFAKSTELPMRRSKCGSVLFSILAIAGFVGATQQTGFANLLTTDQFVTEFLAESQGEDAGFILRFFGPDANSPLSFASNVDLAAMTFSYSSVPGQTYQGLAFSLNGSGIFDAITNVWTTSSSVTLGSTSWTTLGADVITNPDLAFHSHKDAKDDNGNKIADVDDDKEVDPDGTSFGVYWFTDVNGNQMGNTFPIHDQRKRAEWNWKVDGSQAVVASGVMPFQITSTGFSPIDGGAGTFTTTISPVPEPPYWLVCLIIAGMMFFGRARSRLFPAVQPDVE